jgi:hypothetical protein
MPDYLGPSAAIDLVANVGGIDPEVIVRFQQRLNQTPQDAINAAAAAIGMANQRILDRYGAIAYLTDDVSAFYSAKGASGKTPKKAEFSDAQPVRGVVSGHMLPREDFQDQLGWSQEWFRDASRAHIDADIQAIVDRWFNRANFDILTRCLSYTEDAVGTGYSVGWAIGSTASTLLTGAPTINVPFDPPQFGSAGVTTTHLHYVVKNSSTEGIDRADLFESMIEELRHHGLKGREVFCLVSDADLTAIRALSGFASLKDVSMNVVTGGSSLYRYMTGKNTRVPGTLIGFYSSARGDIALRTDVNIPTGYAFMTVSMGVNNPNNGLAIRTQPGVPWGLRPIAQGDGAIPPRLKGIKFEAVHGIGVNNRLNGVAGYIAAGATTYTNPTSSL